MDLIIVITNSPKKSTDVGLVRHVDILNVI